MNQNKRNKLRVIVTQCRKLLEDSTAQALQGRFGIYPSRKKSEVQIEDESRMAHLTDEDCTCRQDLIDHLEHIQAIGYKPSEALEQLTREISFTHLNRICAYKMMESRGLIREAVSRGLKSQGFFFYLSDHPEDERLHNGGEQETAYRNFLDWLGGTLSQEIGVLFNPNDPANRIYPPQRVLEDVLALINDGDLKDIWSQDETIGWVYQYFTPKELRDKARKESQAPRNSYELAFRNQFFTPRYVVEFLTDNTLGRIWYEMCKGTTILKDHCKYLVRRPVEVFLKDGEQPPIESSEVREDLSQEELLKQPVYIPHRPKKDPRELKILDPACGSGHFLLYCFDLLQTIYEEAYDDPDLSEALRKYYPAIEDLHRAVPGLILKHNLHGIDIDLRATQIAALALWLRCQRAYQEMGLKNGERPKITRSNIVCAESMPGEEDLLKEFTATLQPKVLGQLVEAVFVKMKLAGEAGSLLKIEEEIREAAGTAQKEYQEELRRQKEQAGYLPGMAPDREPTLFDFSDMTDSEFLGRAEKEIVDALQRYAEKTSNGGGFRRRLFAEDAARAFGYLDLSHHEYDIILMNPPFGAVSKPARKYVKERYKNTFRDIYATFVERSLQLLVSCGRLGAITSSTYFNLATLEELRGLLLTNVASEYFVHLGNGIMDDAAVNAACMVVQKRSTNPYHQIRFFDVRKSDDKSVALLKCVDGCTAASSSITSVVTSEALCLLPKKLFGYWLSGGLRYVLTQLPRLAKFAKCQFGLHCHGNDDQLFRAWWEPAPNSEFQQGWPVVILGGEPEHFYRDSYYVVNWKNNGEVIHEIARTAKGGTLVGNEYYFQPGLTYIYTAQTTFSVQTLESGSVFTAAAHGCFPVEGFNRYVALAFLNSESVRLILKVINPDRFFQTAYVRLLPVPKIEDIADKLETSATEALNICRSHSQGDECSRLFIRDWASTDSMYGTIDLTAASESAMDKARQLKAIKEAIDLAVKKVYGLNDFDLALMLERVGSSTARVLPGDQNLIESGGKTALVSHVSYILGVTFGRWDIRFATGERQPQELPDPFDPLPVCPPGVLQGSDGLPAKPEHVPSDYPIRIDWDGILVDDPEHGDDIVRRVRDVLEVIWKDRAEAIETEACGILGVRELRDYFRKPGNGGFWMDHVKRYSKSRRKAPIYWYLRSAKGSYGLWLYYHRLDKDILFKALLNYVEPKVRMEEDRLKSLRGRKEAVGNSGIEAKQIEKDMDRQEQLVSELHDFADKLRRAANLHLIPDLNDGVVLTIAPLFELVPWKEAKAYWEDLLDGKYEWSSIGKQLREMGLVKN